MKKPEFFLVGAPKAGTTSMTRYLRQHPAVFIPEDIDPNFFPEDVSYDDVFEDITTKSEYLSRFEPAHEGNLLGDTSTMNLYSDTAAENIKAFNSSAKILIMLRNPIEMMYSLHSHYLFGGNESIENFREALKKEPERKRGRALPETVRFPQGLYYREIANYRPQIKRYFDTFDRDQIKIILFRDFTQRTPECYRDTLEFLGLDPTYQPDFQVHNENKTIRFETFHRFVRNPPGAVLQLLRGFDRVFPSWFFRKPLDQIYRWLNTETTERDEMDPGLRKELEKEFRQPVAKLSQLIDRDLSHWFVETDFIPTESP